MPQTLTTTPAACRTHPDRAATLVVEYRVPDPHSATGDETFDPAYLLVCPDERCVDLAEDEAVWQGATETLIDTRLLTHGEADAILGEVA